MTDINYAFDPVTVPGVDGNSSPEVIREGIDTWVSSPPMRALLERFGATMPTGTLAERLSALEAFTAEAWDFRRADEHSLERNQVNLGRISDFDTEQLVLAAATALGFVEPRPPRKTYYDHVVVLGGLVRANAWRTSYAAHLIESGTIGTSQVTALTANRPLAANPEDPTRDEHVLLKRLGYDPADYESEVMDQSLRRRFSVTLESLEADGPEVPVESRRRVARATTTAGFAVTLLVAPPADPTSGKRADTATTYKYWATLEHLTAESNILVVTSCIYVPYHALVALQNIGVPYGATIETVGVDYRVIDTSAAPQNFRAVNYTQEVRSTLRASTTLLNQLPNQ